MPGVCAYVPRSESRHKSVISEMLRRLAHFEWHRPSQYVDSTTGVGLGLVTLDTVAASSRLLCRGNTVVAFDGEIYGSQEPAADLLAGLQGGLDSLLDLNGMFSAVTWDGDSGELSVVTDRFGMKPIYVGLARGAIAIASEVNALLAAPGIDTEWSEVGAAQFFAFGQFLNDNTFLRGVRAIGPATVATWRSSGEAVRETRYWRPSSRPMSGSLTDGVNRLEGALVAAVECRAGANERLGLSLSSGLDARTLLGLVPSSRNLTSVSIGIGGGIDHRGATELASLAGVPHHCYVLDDAFLGHYEDHLKSMIALTDGHYLDQGIVMPTLPTYRSLGIDVLLRGHGGEMLHMRKAYAFSMDDGALDASEREIEAWLWSHLTGYMLADVPRDLFTFDIDELARGSLKIALSCAATSTASVDRVWQLFLTERLHRETALSMQLFGNFSTIRMPFIDNDVVDALFELPARAKMGDELQTAILRHRRPEFLGVVNSNTGAKMGAGRISTRAAWLRMKVGAKLGLPGFQPYERLGLWLRRELRPLVERVLLGDEFLAGGLVRPDAVRRVVTEHFSGANHTYLVMSLVIVGLRSGGTCSQVEDAGRAVLQATTA